MIKTFEQFNLYESKNLGFSWIDMKQIFMENYFVSSRIVSFLNNTLKGKTVIIYKKEKGQYVPFNRMKPKIKVKKFDTDFSSNKYYGIVVLIGTNGSKTEIKEDDMIKIVGVKMVYGDMFDIDPYGEENWLD
jgi:hypothetical protein